MIVLIAGSSHSGKTLLSQKLLDKYKFPYISIDHLKMGLIRSGNTDLTPEDDDKLTDYLWPIVREIVKTAIENKQNLIIEGCYIPFNWKDSFDKDYAKQIKYICLIMTKKYIEDNFSDIKNYANIIEKRLDDSSCIKEDLIKDNELNLNMCKKYNCDYILIDNNYKFEVVL
ncbi:adenylate kinase [Paraclostridium bifermentans]|jgi:adenylate kinase family enzyme|uniref:adenylate kinase n=1 Tax=Paraclostridium bifermentans TaxID=1490 RepID=UPI00189B3520|nr:adenylate kinase [Paraclostridium bifermentans]